MAGTNEFLLLVRLSHSRLSLMFKDFSLVCRVVGSLLTRTKEKSAKMIINFHSLLFIVICCHLRSFFVALVFTRFATRYHSLSFLVIPCYSLSLSLSLSVSPICCFVNHRKTMACAEKKLNTNYIDSSYLFAIQKSKSTCFQK